MSPSPPGEGRGAGPCTRHLRQVATGLVLSQVLFAIIAFTQSGSALQTWLSRKNLQAGPVPQLGNQDLRPGLNPG